MSTKIPLIKISDDVLIDVSYTGRYKNLDGTAKHGVYLRKYKNTTDKLFINNGYLMRLYKYPNIKPKFISKKINDYNLHLCGGWSFTGVDNKETITRVIEGLKPIGFFITTEVKKYESICKKINLLYKIIPNHTTKKYFNIGISCKGTFGENFDLNSLITDYINYNKVKKFFIQKRVENFILSLKNIQINSYLSFDYTNPNNIQEIIVTGLILGYPIETTVSILLYNY